MVIAVTFAYGITYLWVRGSAGMRLFAELCILIPFWISVLTCAFGWVALLSNRGLINTWLTQPGVIAEPLTLVRNEFGVVLGMVHFLIPFAVFPSRLPCAASTTALLAARLALRRPAPSAGLPADDDAGFWVRPSSSSSCARLLHNARHSRSGADRSAAAELIYLRRLPVAGLGPGGCHQRADDRHRRPAADADDALAGLVSMLK